jgi:acetylornithine deacetylase/succinyl-diaminopimelate desuccinylase-like protein
MIGGAVAWLSDPKHPNYKAAAKAIEKVYGAAPDYTREGGSIPITSTLEEATGMNVLLLPIGACDDMAHSQNEKYNIDNLVNGIKVRDTTVLMIVRVDCEHSRARLRFLDSTCTSLATLKGQSRPRADAFL